MDKIQALHDFWSSFDLPAYDEGDVPDDANMPYITYSVSTDEFDRPVMLSASLWYYSSSWAAITQMAALIAETISKGGIMISYEHGAFWLRKGSPWSVRVPDPSDDMIRHISLNIEAEFLD